MAGADAPREKFNFKPSRMAKNGFPITEQANFIIILEGIHLKVNKKCLHDCWKRTLSLCWKILEGGSEGSRFRRPWNVLNMVANKKVESFQWFLSFQVAVSVFTVNLQGNCTCHPKRHQAWVSHRSSNSQQFHTIRY